jgi:DNA-binding NarL/FixJ family response regulator
LTRIVSRTERWCASARCARLVKRSRSLAVPFLAVARPAAADRDAAALVARGRTNREVAAALFLSEKTIENHLSRVYAKLGVRSRAELVGILG